MPLVTLLCGPAGAGKTTFAGDLAGAGAVRLSMDEAVWADGWRDHQPPLERLAELQDGLQADLRRAVGAGGDVVVDLSLASRAVRDEWTALALGLGADVRLVVLTALFDVLWQRVERRGGDHANSVQLTRDQLRAYVDGFEWPGPDEPHELITTG
mgnify:CR=1 FL=1